MTDQSESDHEYDMNSLIDKMGNIELSDNRFINLKADHPSIDDITATAMIVPRPKMEYGESSRIRSDTKKGGYPIHHFNNYDKSQYTPSEKMRNEPINPYEIYLDLDCVNNVEEAIDKWETALRIAVDINVFDKDTTMIFLEKTLINSVQRF